MKVYKPFFFLILVGSLLFSSCSGEIDYSDPTKVVEAYLEAILSGDCDQAMHYVYGLGESKRRSCEEGTLISLRIDDVYFEGVGSRGVVFVRGEATLLNSDGTTLKDDRIGFPVMEEDEKWYIVD